MYAPEPVVSTLSIKLSEPSKASTQMSLTGCASVSVTVPSISGRSCNVASTPACTCSPLTVTVEGPGAPAYN